MKKEISFFKIHPELYEITFGYRDFKTQVNFLDKIFRKHKVKKVLDVACGHIPHGRELAKMGYNISGIDLSSSLLKLGKRRAKEEKIKIKLYKKDMSNFHIGKFDAAYIMFNSILHLYSHKQLYSHFRSINKNLKKNGIYVIDLSPSLFKDPLKKHKIDREVQGIRSVISYSPIDTKNLIASFKTETYYKNKKYVDKFKILMFLPFVLLQEFAEKTGFEIIDVYSDFKFNKKFNKKRTKYIAILKKK